MAMTYVSQRPERRTSLLGFALGRLQHDRHEKLHGGRVMTCASGGKRPFKKARNSAADKSVYASEAGLGKRYLQMWRSDLLFQCIALLVHSIARTVVFMEAWRNLLKASSAQGHLNSSPSSSSSWFSSLSSSLLFVRRMLVDSTPRRHSSDGNFLPKTRAFANVICLLRSR